ncbi:MAG: hypothetical protein LBK82_09060, partial [Planctomycetaceae bacterium]|nr:hypothetical protein [Planctomycetaceae bacterium]
MSINFLRPLGASRNNPPQRGESMLIHFALKGQWIKIANPFCTALAGRCFGGNITHGVAVGCYAMPLKGRRRKLAILLHSMKTIARMLQSKHYVHL